MNNKLSISLAPLLAILALAVVPETAFGAATGTAEWANGDPSGSATLHGSITPGGETVTKCEFVWEELPLGGASGKAPCQPPPPFLSGFPHPLVDPVEAHIPGLKVCTEYEFALIAESQGESIYGPGPPFATCYPHWFKGGKRQAEGIKVPTVSWGGAVNAELAYFEAPSKQAQISCKTVSGGYIENPKGSGGSTGKMGPAGTGKTLVSANYECVDKTCETEVTMMYPDLGYVGIGFIAGYNFPWSNELLDQDNYQIPHNGAFEERIGATPDAGTGQSWGQSIPGQSEAYAEGFPARSQAPGGHGGAENGTNASNNPGATSRWGAPGAIGLVAGCEIFPNPEDNTALDLGTGLPERVVSETPLEGELHPEVGGELNGVSSPASPAQVQFNGSYSGELAGPVGPGEGGIFKGNLKILGYESQSSISVNY